MLNLYSFDSRNCIFTYCLSQVSDYFRTKNGIMPYMYNPNCDETCPENCQGSWKVLKRYQGYVDYNVTVTNGRQLKINYTHILKTCNLR